MRVSYLLIVFSFISCRSYIDNKTNSFENSHMSFQFNYDQNKFKYYSNINGRADDQTFSSYHFEIDLPKNLINWMVVNNQYYFEYDHNQIVVVYIPYKEEKREEIEWELVDLREDKISNYMYDYWTEMKYNDNKLNALNQKRINKVYTNGKYEIVFYNFKEKNFYNCLDKVKKIELIK